MADPRKFGMAKSFFMRGKAEGFDLSLREGIAAWMETTRARQAGLTAAADAPRDAGMNDDRNKAKAAKASKKKNR